MLINQNNNYFLTIFSLIIIWFIKWRAELFYNIGLFLKQPAYGIVLGLAFGNTDYLPSIHKQNLKIIGIMHIVSASGFNVSLVASFFIKIVNFLFEYCGWANRLLRFVFLTMMVWTYIAIAGASVSLLRAGLSWSLSLWLQFLFHKPSSIMILWLTFLLMLSINFHWLESLSFQLSFLSSFALMHSSFNQRLKLIEELSLSQLNTWWRFLFKVGKESWQTTFSTQLMVTPLLLFVFGEFSMIALFANTFLLWLIPFLTYFSFLLLLTSNFHFLDWLSWLLSLGLTALIEFFLFLVKILASCPYATIELPLAKGNMIILVFGYLLVFVYYWLCDQHSDQNRG